MNTCFSLTMGFSDYGSPLSPHRGQAWSAWKFITSAAVLCPWWTGVVGKYSSYLTTQVGKLWGTCPTLSLRVLHWDWAPVSHRTDFMAHSSLAIFLSLSSEVSFTSQINYSHLVPCLWPLSGAAQPKGRFGLEHSHPAPTNPLPKVSRSIIQSGTQALRKCLLKMAKEGKEFFQNKSLCFLTSQSLHNPEFSGFWPHWSCFGQICQWVLYTKSEGHFAFFVSAPLCGKWHNWTIFFTETLIPCL